MNLIKNSIDFVTKNIGKITITVEQFPEDEGKIVFTVTDNGVGIPAAKSDLIFQKFYQIDASLARKHGGTGLGLTICKGIVETHGGNIWIDKKYMNGTSIKFTLPKGD